MMMHWMRSVGDELHQVVKRRDLIRNLVAKELKVRYKRSVLGFLWVLLNPLFVMLILYFVFSGIFSMNTENYVAYLLCGILFWNFFAQGTATSMQGFVGNASLIRKIYVPKLVFPISLNLSALVNFGFSLIPLSLVVFVTGSPVSPYLPVLPLVVLLGFLFCLGVSLFLSTAMVFFRDTQYIYEVILLGWMYATPIFYPADIVPERFQWLLQINPLYAYVTLFRGTLYAKDAFDPVLLGLGAGFSLLALTAGAGAYAVSKDQVVFHL